MKGGNLSLIHIFNQSIDFDTAEFVATEMGCKVEKEVTVTIEEQIIDDLSLIHICFARTAPSGSG